MQQRACGFRWALVLSAVLLLAGAAGCGRPQSTETEIGVVLPLTGASANHGKDSRDGLDLALADIEAKHLLRGRRLKLVVEDDRSAPASAVSATSKLLGVDKVRIILGPISSSNMLAMIPVTERAKALLLSPAASSPKISGAGSLVFRTSLLAEPQAAAAASFARKVLKADAASIFFINDDTGRGYAEAFRSDFRAAGGQVLSVDTYEKTDRDFRTKLLKLKVAKAPLVYVPAVPSTMGLIIKQSHEIGYDPLFLSNYGSEGEDLISIAGDLANNRVYLTSVRLDAGFLKRYQARFGKQPGIAAPLAYDALMVLAEAIASVGTDPAALGDALHSLREFQGVTGRFSFDKRGDPVREIVIRTVARGAFQEARQ
jgi:branched-chain amino acid transport system substrate-binding protein